MAPGVRVGVGVGFGAYIVTLAVAVLPVPPLCDFTLPVTTVKLPAPLPTTGTVTTQLPPLATVPPEKEIPVGAVSLSVPPQTEEVFVDTASPAGSVAAKLTPVRSFVFSPGFERVKASDDAAPTVPLGELKAALIDGGERTYAVNMAKGPVLPGVETV